jgi:adenosylhomocysteinase
MTADMSSIVDPALAPVGQQRIRWAKDHMPALSAASGLASESGALAGRRVGVILTLEPKTACLALAFKATGASVSVYCAAPYVSDDVAAALTAEGIDVFARSDADRDADEVLLNRFIDTRVEYLVDDGAGATRYIHTRRRDALEHLKGVAEETTSGVRPLRVMAADGALKVPALAVNDASSKQLFDNVYGTGASVITTLLDVTNMQMQGKSVVVVGYGYVGRGIAGYARALGARVTVTEIDPIRALQALHDGHGVARLEEMCPTADVFITATGIGYSLTGDHMRLMKDGAIVSVGGAGPPEVDLGGTAPVQRGQIVREAIREIQIDHGRSVFLIADGECSNVSAGEGNPIEIMDLSFAVQLRSVDYLAHNAQDLEPGVHPVPETIDKAVALSLLRAQGADVDTPTEQQRAHAESWDLADGEI